MILIQKQHNINLKLPQYQPLVNTKSAFSQHMKIKEKQHFMIVVIYFCFYLRGAGKPEKRQCSLSYYKLTQLYYNLFMPISYLQAKIQKQVNEPAQQHIVIS